MRVPLLILHKPHRQPYHVLNSLDGPRIVARLGANAWDCDVNVTRDHVQVATHWPRPMMRDGFRDPTGQLGRRTPVWDMTAAQVARLRAGDTAISTCIEVARAAKAHGVTVCFEVKTWTPKALGDLADAVHVEGLPVVIMAQPQRVGALQVAARLELPTLLLARGTVPRGWARFLTYVKGSRRSVRNLHGTRVRRIGLGPRDATRHGAGCRPSNVAAVRAAVRAAVQRKRKATP